MDRKTAVIEQIQVSLEEPYIFGEHVVWGPDMPICDVDRYIEGCFSLPENIPTSELLFRFLAEVVEF